MTIDLHTLSGAYVLDALSAEEAEEFRLHLEGCAACRDEVRELRQAAAEMGASEALAPPAALRARVLAAA
ncbi:MAG: zf-HC2 domain-containing protein, partial [Nocardioidaceae bacterium]|nr:zf-HC2 domain-containing protein [Nocardioidaceae bacterium]